MRIAFVAALLGAGLSCALAQTAPLDPAPSRLSPRPNAPSVTLFDSDIAQIQQWLAMAKVHQTMPDGTTHPMVDGAELLTFLGTLKQEQAKAKADMEKAVAAPPSAPSVIPTSIPNAAAPPVMRPPPPSATPTPSPVPQ